MKIIGLSGKIGTGKNYIGEKLIGRQLYNMGYNIHILAFGDQVKYEFGSRMSVITDISTLTSEMDDVYNKLFVNKTKDIRTKLQYYATEHCREGTSLTVKDDFIMFNEPNIWIKSLYLQIKNILSKSYDTARDVFIITDVRFQNEANFIKYLDGIIIRIEAPIRNYDKIKQEVEKTCLAEDDIKTEIEKISNHCSETDLDTYIFNYTVENDYKDLDMEDTVVGVVNSFIKRL